MLIRLVVICVTLLGAPLVAAAASDCSILQINAGLCSISSSTTSTAVVLDGTVQGGGGETGDEGSWSDDLGLTEAEIRECERQPLQPDRCYRQPPFPTEAAPVVALADVAAFTPSFAPAVSEPGGWAIVGLPVNLVGPAGSVVADGTLLGAPAQVRFSPVAWRWDHGDGTAAAHPLAGASWAQSGLPEFAATATSHAYTSPGRRLVTLAVTVVAEYRFDGGGWLPVTGMLTVPVSEFELVVATADTVLVERDCRVAPAGPGC